MTGREKVVKTKPRAIHLGPVLQVLLEDCTKQGQGIMTLEQFAENSYAFGGDLYKELVDPWGKLVFSPMSIQMCLTMAYMAAGGRTYEEMGKVLKYGANSNKEEVAKIFQKILEDAEKENGLEIANRIYVTDKYKLKPSFNKLTEKCFKSGVESLNFAQSEDAAAKINAWVEKKTHGKIKKPFDPDSFEGETSVVLVNAIYFKGKWLHPFNKTSTTKMTFWSTPTSFVNVDTMIIMEDFKYGSLDKLDATALEMKYKDSNISMLIILPNKKGGLGALEDEIHQIGLKEIDSQMKRDMVQVFLPKFEFEFTEELNDVLSELGMESAFSSSADFSGLLASPEPLKIMKVVHKAYIKVDEEGTEAVAFTGMRGGGPPRPFCVDHPFMFMLLLKDLVLFSGSVRRF